MNIHLWSFKSRWDTEAVIGGQGAGPMEKKIQSVARRGREITARGGEDGSGNKRLVQSISTISFCCK
jgi:hypothetical protein